MDALYGAILGDIIGSPYEFGSFKEKQFPLFSARSGYTDDTVMTIAVAQALMDAGEDAPATRIEDEVRKSMLAWGRAYPGMGYGARFNGWLSQDDPKPYNSWGNGSAMRVSPAGWLCSSLERTRQVARATAMPTHNHPEGIKGAEATAAAIYLARTGHVKDEIRDCMESEFGYDLGRTLDEIRPGYHHVESCMETVPEAVTAFLEGRDFEDVIRNAVSLSGDTDTLAAIAGSIAGAYFAIPDELVRETRTMLPADMLKVVDEFGPLAFQRQWCPVQWAAFERQGGLPEGSWLDGVTADDAASRVWQQARDAAEVYIACDPHWDPLHMEALAQEYLSGKGKPRLEMPVDLRMNLVRQSDTPNPDEKLLPIFSSLDEVTKWPDAPSCMATPLLAALGLANRSDKVSGVVLDPLSHDIVIGEDELRQILGRPPQEKVDIEEIKEESIEVELPPIGSLENAGLENAISEAAAEATPQAVTGAVDALYERMRDGGQVLFSYYIAIGDEDLARTVRDIVEGSVGASKLVPFEVLPNTITSEGDGESAEWIGIFTQDSEILAAEELDFVVRLSIERVFQLTLAWPQASGVVVNPFGQYMQLSRDMVSSLLDRLDREVQK